MNLFTFRQFKSTRTRRILDSKKYSGYVQGAGNIYGERSVKKIMMLWRKECLSIRNNERFVRKGVSFIQKSATSFYLLYAFWGFRFAKFPQAERWLFDRNGTPTHRQHKVGFPLKSNYFCSPLIQGIIT